VDEGHGHPLVFFNSSCLRTIFTSFNTTLTFIVIHLESNDFFLFFLKNFEPNKNFELSTNSFKLTFYGMPHLFVSNFSKMAFEHFLNYFHLKILEANSHSCFNFVLILHKVTFHVELHVSRAARLLTLTKSLNRCCNPTLR